MKTAIMVRDVRSFAGSHRIDLRPLTFVVGDNSSGKTTLLGLVYAVHQGWAYPANLALSNAPFDFGGYGSIVTRRLGRKGIPKSFAVGATVDAAPGSKIDVTATYMSGALGQPQLQKLEFSASPYAVSIELPSLRSRGSLRVEHEGRDLFGSKELAPGPATLQFDPYSWVRQLMDARPWVGSLKAESRPLREAGEFLQSLIHRLPHFFDDKSVVALAPIRSEPKRTYERYAPQADPSGSHVPVVLAGLLEQSEEDEARKRLLERLHTFSTDAGLFRELGVRSLGEKGADPFQLQVRSSSVRFNLADVGYGVNQSLPVAVEAIRSKKETLLLLQQPEVHLHPRAQAALGSLFVRLRTEDGKSFVIETHSDYLIDRVRMHVAQGDIAPGEVEILFLECVDGVTRAHRIDFDKRGNISNAPDNYREFFMSEQRKLLSR